MRHPIYLFSISSHPDAIHINPLKVTFLNPNIDFSLYDNLIITSKQTSEALKQYDKEEYVDIPALCISKKSAESYSDLGAKILEIGEGYGDTLLELIKKYPKSKRWLYLRAQTVASDFVEVLQNESYDIDEAIVYKSECSQEIKNIDVEDDSVLIFTSPSSVKCFLKNKKISQKNKVIVIGKTTAKELPVNVKYNLSKDKTIESCIEMLSLL